MSKASKGGAAKSLLNHVFIDGLSGMALGLFATLIIGTIADQIGQLVGGRPGEYICLVASVAKGLMGAGIGVGISYKYRSTPLVSVSAAVAGMVGAFASKIIAGEIIVGGALTLSGPGEPLGAFIAALVAIEVGNLVAGKTSVDILVTPFVTITSGSVVGLVVGPPISKLMTLLGNAINWGTEQQPIIMGIVVSVLMGMILTLPISSAALGVILGLSGIAAGAATVGCCTQMIGFAVASYRENKVGGLIAQGVGTSMLQIPNIVRRPIIWIPAIVSSAILGPVASAVLHMVSTPVGSGMGSAGFVGQIAAFGAMTEAGMSTWMALLQIAIMHFILPALLTLGVSEFMRKKGWIREGDMELKV